LQQFWTLQRQQDVNLHVRVLQMQQQLQEQPPQLVKQPRVSTPWQKQLQYLLQLEPATASAPNVTTQATAKTAVRRR
jgi:hypothetical protein